MPQYNVQELLQKLESLGVRPNKKLGQNFLVNQEVCKKIVGQAMKLKPSTIVEVGPGLGALTDQDIGSVPQILIELDRGFVEYWKSQSKNIIHEDALKLDWSILNLPVNSLLLSNLPYQISASLVIDRSIEPFNISYMVLMFQKEVAQRILAKPKTENYGLLSVISQAFWNVEYFVELSSKDFYPPPQVASRVLVFKRKKEVPSAPNKFLNFIKLAFAQRRKFLISNLGAYKTKDELLKSFESLKISEKVRAEELSVEQFIELFNSL